MASTQMRVIPPLAPPFLPLHALARAPNCTGTDANPRKQPPRRRSAPVRQASCPMCNICSPGAESWSTNCVPCATRRHVGRRPSGPSSPPCSPASSSASCSACRCCTGSSSQPPGWHPSPSSGWRSSASAAETCRGRSSAPVSSLVDWWQRRSFCPPRVQRMVFFWYQQEPSHSVLNCPFFPYFFIHPFLVA